MRKMRLIAVLPLLCIATVLYGQVLSPTFNSAYKREAKIERRPIPYAPLREADVMWSKYIWRTIDLREKFNHSLYYPTEPKVNYQSLFDVLLMGVKEGTITGYDAIDDQFRFPLSSKEVWSILSDTVTLPFFGLGINILDS